MDNPTDAAVEARFFIEHGMIHDRKTGKHVTTDDDSVFCDGRVACCALLNELADITTRQPGPEDVERIRIAVLGPIASGHPAERLCVDIADDCARAILALYPAPPAPAHAPTRSALDSALDPMLGNTPVRKAVVDVVMRLFENARRPLTEADVVRIAKSATNIRAARDGGYRMWADLSNYSHTERAQFTRDTLTAASWPMTAPMDSVASDRLAWLEKAHGETMDQNARLIVERDALNARVADLEALTVESPVYSSAFDELLRGALARIAEFEASKSGRRLCRDCPWDAPKQTQTPPGAIRLGEGLTEAQEAVIRDMTAERQRQVSVEGWTAEHDDNHIESQLAFAAACYALHAAFGNPGREDDSDAPRRAIITSNWPWSWEWWKPSVARSDLVKAGALILAEIERLDRAALRASAIPKPEAVDWAQYAQEYIGGARAFDPDIIMTGLCEQIAALRAGGV